MFIGGKFHLGLRTIKTSLAVMLCIIFFQLTDRGNPVIASLGAVFALREDISSSVNFGKSRVVATLLGGVNALLYYFFLRFFDSQDIVQVILVPVFVALTIAISVGLDNKTGVIGSVATLLVIAFTIPKSESVLYVINRVVDTFIGTFFAIAINYLIKSPKEDKGASIEEKLLKIKEKEREITQLKQDIKDLRR
ncbi:FUSC family protein [Vagococcus acidifermentans]|uniref:FUSC family protein n=1 Tax=Vagococcus acidifermentans TaxID=564710 RepID=A0A430AWW4_9ENTE|nr:aromatic acid exporter family protein [Vagococcus acidifermentans]RSU12526.1 hypothetical protein CBF27_06005 [Vagococcus acidifermentans]